MRIKSLDFNPKSCGPPSCSKLSGLFVSNSDVVLRGHRQIMNGSIFTVCFVNGSFFHSQNVPQLALQIVFLVEHGDSASADLIVYGSMLFSLLSIIVNTLTFCTQREVLKRIGTVTVQFDITITNGRRHRNRIKELRRDFADILEIDSSLIGIGRASSIRNGLRMEIQIYGNHDNDISGNFRRYIQSGEIAKSIQSAWNLKQTPIVSKLKVERTQNIGIGQSSEVQIGSMTNSPSHRDDIKKMVDIKIDAVYPQIQDVDSVFSQSTARDPEL